MQNEKLLGLPSAVAQVLIGAVIALAITVPLFLYILRKRRTQSVTTINRELRERLQSDIVLSAIEDGVAVIAPDKTIQAFNPGAGHLVGWNVNEALGLDHHLVIKMADARGEIKDEKQNPIDQVFVNKATVRANQLFLLTKGGKQVNLSVSVSPMLDNAQNIVAAVAIFRDVSLESRQQQQRAEFISTASHEMRTPVAAIEGYLSLAMNENVSKIDQKAREFLDKAHASTQHLGKLFQDLLTTAKAEDGRLPSHPQIIEVGYFLEQLVDGLRFAAEKKGLTTEFITGTEESIIDASNPNAKVVKPLYYVYADPERIREAITNLFDNAVKYTESGKITIGLSGDNNVVQIRVGDTGPGIPPDDVPHLFEKFYRVDSSATRTIGGTGLGLFICRKIVELYNGRIWVDSTVGKGSTFYINLPRVPSDKARQVLSTQGQNYPQPVISTEGGL